MGSSVVVLLEVGLKGAVNCVKELREAFAKLAFGGKVEKEETSGWLGLAGNPVAGVKFGCAVGTFAGKSGCVKVSGCVNGNPLAGGLVKPLTGGLVKPLAGGLVNPLADGEMVCLAVGGIGGLLVVKSCLS